MNDETSFRRWKEIWARAVESIDDPLLQPPEALAEQSFLLLMESNERGHWLESLKLDELARDCALFACRMRHGGPGFVKCVYFSTKDSQSARVLASLVFMTIFARLNNYPGPLAWISFPVSLLWSPVNPTSSRIANEIRATLENIRHVPDELLAAPIDFALGAFRRADEANLVGEDPPSIYFNSSYPFRQELGDKSPVDIDVQYGLPLICIPSRATEKIAVRMTPSPLLGGQMPEERP
jgi:hypothetical protein